MNEQSTVTSGCVCDLFKKSQFAYKLIYRFKLCTKVTYITYVTYIDCVGLAYHIQPHSFVVWFECGISIYIYVCL